MSAQLQESSRLMVFVTKIRKHSLIPLYQNQNKLGLSLSLKETLQIMIKILSKQILQSLWALKTHHLFK